MFLFNLKVLKLEYPISESERHLLLLMMFTANGASWTFTLLMMIDKSAIFTVIPKDNKRV